MDELSQDSVVQTCMRGEVWDEASTSAAMCDHTDISEWTQRVEPVSLKVQVESILLLLKVTFQIMRFYVEFIWRLFEDVCGSVCVYVYM